MCESERACTSIQLFCPGTWSDVWCSPTCFWTKLYLCRPWSRTRGWERRTPLTWCLQLFKALQLKRHLLKNETRAVELQRACALIPTLPLSYHFPRNQCILCSSLVCHDLVPNPPSAAMIVLCFSLQSACLKWLKLKCRAKLTWAAENELNLNNIGQQKKKKNVEC